MNFIKRIFVLFGNYFPAPLNKIFYKLAGIKFNLKNVWIGTGCFFDTKYPENIIIEDGVCISFKVILITHFDPTNSIKDHPIKKYNKKIIIKKGVFIGPGSIIYPGVTLHENAFIKAGSVIQNDVNINEIYEGNPASIFNILDKRNK